MKKESMAEKDRKALLFFGLTLGIFSLFLLLPLFLSMNRQEKERQIFQNIKDTTIELSNQNNLTGTSTSNEFKRKLCFLKARPETEREKTITSVKNLLDNPGADVIYVCDDSFYSPAEDKVIPAKTETYTAGSDTFLVNPTTNHIVQFSINSGKWGFPKDKSNSYYSQKELEDLVQNFINKHSLSLGAFDLSKLAFEINKKGDGISDTNYFLTWQGESKTVKLDKPAITCSLDIPKSEPGIYYDEKGTPCIKHFETTVQPTLQLAITNKGYFLNYSNSFEGEVGRAASF